MQWLQPESELFCLFSTEHEILSRAVLKTNPRDAVKPHSPLASALFRAIFPHKSFMTMQVIIRKSSRVIIVQFCMFVCVVVRTAHFQQLTLQLGLNWRRLCLFFQVRYKTSRQ